jgi:uncharacterized protein (TIGR00299 family) protein
MTTVAWWHCFSGIAGDMALGSLVDAGADLAQIERELAALPVGGWGIEAHEVTRGGVAATHLDVRTDDTTVVRTHAHIEGIITEARLPERVRQRALATFARLARVEGRLHRMPPSQVHFHEVGGLDAIIDIVGTCVALEVLGIDDVHCSPVAQGIGMIRSAHGFLPNPVPATVELLRDAPTYGTDVPLELTTPTGAALVATLASRWGPMPAMRIQTSGFGAGSRDLEGRPNAVQVIVGQAMPDEGSGDQDGQPVVLLEANVDDVTGEILAHVVTALLAAGAHDAWLAPVIGKKGRPAHIVTALVDPVRTAEIRRVLMAETGTLGVRSHPLSRWVAARRIEAVEVGGHPVRVKHSAGRVKAEFEDTVRVGNLLDLPAREVARRAEGLAAPAHPSASG